MQALFLFLFLGGYAIGFTPRPGRLILRLPARRLGTTLVRRSLGRLSVTPRTCRLRRRACRKRLSRPLSVTSPPCGSCARPSVCAVSLRASLFGTFPDRAAHFLINDSLLRAETEGRIRLLRRCRRACATSPGIGVKPSFRLRSSSRYKSSRRSRSKRKRQVRSVA